MSWTDSVKTEAAKPAPVEAPKVDEKSTSGEPKKEEVKLPATEEPKKDSENSNEKKESKSEDEKKLVPQDVVGKAIKKIREKSRETKALSEARIRQLEEENKALREAQLKAELSPDEIETQTKLQEQIQAEILRREDEYGRRKYGEETFRDAIELIKIQNDPALTNKIWSAPRPADALIEEATRIADEMQLGETPEERRKNERERLRAEVRAELEAEYEQKLKGRVNQPTNLNSLRASGGDSIVSIRDTWTTGSKPLPGRK